MNDIDWDFLKEAVFDEDLHLTTGSYTITSFSSEDEGGLKKGDDKQDSKQNKNITKRKRESIQDIVSKLEEQNKIMRHALAEKNISLTELMKKQQRRVEILLQNIAAFNSGDIDQLVSFIQKSISEDCLLLTPSLFQELRGKNAVVQFWTLILEAFPDGIFQLSQTTVEDNGFVSSRFVFTGTKVSSLPSDALLQRWRSFVEIEKRNSQTSTSGAGVAFKDFKATFFGTPTTSNITSSANSVHEQKSAILNTSINQIDLSTSTPAMKDDVTGKPKQPLPKVNMAGYLAVTFDEQDKINRFIFVWNSTSLIGQILGLSNGDLEAISNYFNKSSKQISQA